MINRWRFNHRNNLNTPSSRNSPTLHSLQTERTICLIDNEGTAESSRSAHVASALPPVRGAKRGLAVERSPLRETKVLYNATSVQSGIWVGDFLPAEAISLLGFFASPTNWFCSCSLMVQPTTAFRYVIADFSLRSRSRSAFGCPIYGASTCDACHHSQAGTRAARGLGRARSTHDR